MMSKDNSPSSPRWLRKLLIPALVGGMAGFVASAGILRFIESDTVGGLGVSGTIAAIVGVLYAVIGFGIMLGTASPGLGARYLNVEDAEELREQKRMLTLSGAAMVLWGVSLLALALAAPDGPLSRVAALVIGAGSLVIGIALSVMVYRVSDELMAAVNLEAGALSYALVSVAIGLWGMLAHLDYVDAPAPLDLLTLFYVLVMVASFIAVGRRGMLVVR